MAFPGLALCLANWIPLAVMMLADCVGIFAAHARRRSGAPASPGRSVPELHGPNKRLVPAVY